jgi:hypothetical protein
MLVAGVALLIGYRNFSTSAVTDSLAGFVLGALLTLIGGGMFVAGAQQAVTVDPRSRRIIIDERGMFGPRKTEIPFAEIVDVDVEGLGDDHEGSPSYHLVAKLKSGKEAALFLGFYEGAHDRRVSEARRARLMSYLHSPG